MGNLNWDRNLFGESFTKSNMSINLATVYELNELSLEGPLAYFKFLLPTPSNYIDRFNDRHVWCPQSTSQLSLP